MWVCILSQIRYKIHTYENTYTRFLTGNLFVYHSMLRAEKTAPPFIEILTTGTGTTASDGLSSAHSQIHVMMHFRKYVRSLCREGSGILVTVQLLLFFQEPTHTYTVTGSFDVMVVLIKQSGGRDTIIEHNFIQTK